MTRDARVLFWDLDGTLLTTARAGILAWEDALADVTGLHLDLGAFATAGLIDPAIAASLLSLAGVEHSTTRVNQLCAAYERHLPGRLGERKGHVMPHVREILDEIGTRCGVHQFLLTGNLRSCALAKLRHYGIDQLSAGAFADDAAERIGIARSALALATEALGQEPRSEQLYVIGDTPHDVACAEAISARAIAVATGPVSYEELRRSGAWVVLEQLPEPREFFDLVGIT